MSNNYEFNVHKAVFENDFKKLNDLIGKCDFNQKDLYGNTPLHLAVILGHKKCIEILLEQDVPIKTKNLQGWTPLAEAISYGDRQTISSLLKRLKKQTKDSIISKRPFLIKALNEIGNFYMELKWDFQSWVPLVSRILPSDICKIYKNGCNLRVNTTLADFDEMKWVRGDLSFLFLGNEIALDSFIMLDNKLKTYQKIKSKNLNLDDETDILMSTDIVAIQLSTKDISFTRANSGWIFKEKRSELVGSFLAEFYSIDGLFLESRKRREHLNEEDLQKNKAFSESLYKNKSEDQNDQNKLFFSFKEDESDKVRRKSLAKPPINKFSWDEYINGEAGKPLCLGRQMICKDNIKPFKATIGMSKDFPLTVNALINILDAIAPFKHFNKLRDFIEMKLPPGFPVHIEIPILPTVTARITFQEFKFDNNLDQNLFKVPDDFKRIKSLRL